MARSIQVSGDDAMARRLRAIGAQDHTAVMRRVAQETARGTTGVAVDTGRLAGSIEVLYAGPEGYAVGSRVEYAGYVFHGTRYVDARPPRVPEGGGRAVGQGIIEDWRHAT